MLGEDPNLSAQEPEPRLEACSHTDRVFAHQVDGQEVSPGYGIARGKPCVAKQAGNVP